MKLRASMERSEAIDELVQQHATLRAIMDDCELLADQIDDGCGDVARLAREVARLRVAFGAHNHDEEQLLRPILRSLEPVGALRVEHELADHVEQHRVIARALDAPTAELRATIFHLRAHLAAEERYLLAAGVRLDADSRA